MELPKDNPDWIEVLRSQGVCLREEFDKMFNEYPLNIVDERPPAGWDTRRAKDTLADNLVIAAKALASEIEAANTFVNIPCYNSLMKVNEQFLMRLKKPPPHVVSFSKWQIFWLQDTNPWRDHVDGWRLPPLLERMKDPLLKSV